MRKAFLNGLTFVAIVIGIKYLILSDNLLEYILWIILTIFNAGLLIETLKERK